MTTSKRKPVLGREARRYRKVLQVLSDTVLLFLDALDKAVATRRDIPSDISSWLGKSANKLDMENDRIRYFELDVDYRSDDKPKAVARIKQERATMTTRSERCG